MPQKRNSKLLHQSPRKKPIAATFQFPAGENGLLEFTQVVTAIRSSNSLKAVLEVIDLRMEDLGRCLGQTPQFQKRRPEGFSKGYISQLSSGKKTPSRSMLNAISVVLSRELSTMLNQEIGVNVARNSPWRFRLAKKCDEHGPYELIGNRKHCPLCKK